MVDSLWCKVNVSRDANRSAIQTVSLKESHHKGTQSVKMSPAMSRWDQTEKNISTTPYGGIPEGLRVLILGIWRNNPIGLDGMLEYRKPPTSQSSTQHAISCFRWNRPLTDPHSLHKMMPAQRRNLEKHGLCVLPKCY